ncbi:MAG: PilN domain-containing protein [Bryobacterales bacterium]|nr:PilN domain-containing protein [Bryobacterales bacterium]
MEMRSWLAFGTGAGIEIQGGDLLVTVSRVRPKGITVLGQTVIANFRDRPAAEWGAEYDSFLRAHGAGYLSATLVLPRRDVIVRLVQLPGVADKDLPAAIGYQVDSLHPWGEDEIEFAWQRVSTRGAVMVGMVRRETVLALAERFGEAGVSLAAFTFSAGALHGGARLLSQPPKEGFFLALEARGESEIYGESPSRPVFTAAFDLPLERAAALAVSELRLEPGTAPANPAQILPPPLLPADFDLSRSRTSYAASLAGACPRLARAANLLPAAYRSGNSRTMYLPAIALSLVLGLCATGLFVYKVYTDKQYAAELEQEVTELRARNRRVTELDKELGETKQRIETLDAFRSRTRLDMDALAELTRLLPPPIFANSLQVSRDSVIVAGEAEQAAPLLQVIDSSPHFHQSAFAVSLVHSANGELFRIRALRQKPPAPGGQP